MPPFRRMGGKFRKSLKLKTRQKKSKTLHTMNKIEIRNFGPIETGYDGMMPICPVTIFCGTQGAGKSTVAKLISTFLWMEKALVRGDLSLNKKTDNSAFFRQQCAFHRIHNYFKPNTEIHFTGTLYNFHYHAETFSIEKLPEAVEYPMPKIMYVPAERNFLTVVEHPETLKEIPDSLFVLFSEYNKALKSLNRQMALPIEGYSLQYDKLNNVSWLTGDNFKVRVSEAASGFQSLIPMIIVTHYIAHIVRSGIPASTNLQVTNAIEKRIASILADDSIDENLRRLLISQQSALLKYGKVINIVEEPEQNLYPSSQRSILFDLLSIHKAISNSQLIITTHSPYFIDYITLAIKAAAITPKTEETARKLEAIVPSKSRIIGDDVCIYQIQNGQITELGKYDNMPSDDNMLNQELSDTNEMFAQLFEIEEE